MMRWPRKRDILVVVLLLLLLYICYWPAWHHVQAVVLLVQNRFIHQAFHRAPELSTSDLNNASLLLYWTPFFQNVAFDGFGRELFAKCPVNDCVATNDRRYLRQARAVLFHGADISMFDIPAERPPHQLYMYYVHEAPPLLPLPLGALNTAFNITITYRRDSDIHMPYERLLRFNETSSSPPPLPPPSSPWPPPPTAAETGDPGVAWVVSHCQTDGRREDYVEELRRHITVDEFGACSGRPCPAAGSLPCYRQLARSHTFYLAFENALCRDYITEKFFVALRAGLVPVVRGATRAEYEAVAPADSFLHVDDFAGPRELAAHLRRLAANATALSGLVEWRRHYRFVPRDRWCRVCELMSRRLQPGSAVVDDLHKFWYDDAGCHQ